MQTHRKDITLFNKSINLKTPEVKTWYEIKDPDDLKDNFDLYYKNRYSISNYRVNKEIEDQLDDIDNDLNCDGNNPTKVLEDHRNSEKKIKVTIKPSGVPVYEIYDETWKAEIQEDLNLFWSLEDMSKDNKLIYKKFLIKPNVLKSKFISFKEGLIILPAITI